MLARFSFLLPFELTLDPAFTFQPLFLEVKGETIRVLPPARARLDPRRVDPLTPLTDIPDQLVPAPVEPTTSVQWNGRPTVQANLLMVEFQRPDFDRRQGAPVDPAVEDAFEAANEFLRRFRLLARVHTVSLLNPEYHLWRLRYLDDQGDELPQTEGMIRGRGAVRVGRNYALLAGQWWEALGDAQLGERRIWEELLLDAVASLPDVGPALVMGHSALETFIGWMLDALASRASLPRGLWTWIMTRRREPTLDARLDDLLAVFTGHSLKTQDRLWKGYRDLKDARNAFAHHGDVILGGRTITPDVAADLLNRVRDTIDWIESLVPTDLRRRVVDAGEVRLELFQLIHAPTAEPATTRRE